MAGKGGKRPGSGRKPKRDEEDQAAFMAKHLPSERRVKLLNRMYDIAMGENDKAAVTAGSLLLAYAFGKPAEKHQHSGADGGAIEVVVKHVSTAKT